MLNELILPKSEVSRRRFADGDSDGSKLSVGIEVVVEVGSEVEIVGNVDDAIGLADGSKVGSE